VNSYDLDPFNVYNYPRVINYPCFPDNTTCSTIRTYSGDDYDAQVKLVQEKEAKIKELTGQLLISDRVKDGLKNENLALKAAIHALTEVK